MGAPAAAQSDLISRWQRGFPLVPRPYAAIASALETTETAVIEMLKALARDGVLSRVGAALRPNTAGASVLAAMCVPPDQLEAVAHIVNHEPGVNHNYEREHDFNLWFVMTGRARADVDMALARIRARTGLDILELPLERGYHIDLGFPLDAFGERPVSRSAPQSSPAEIGPEDRRLLEALEPGLAFVSRPYYRLGALSGHTEADAMARIGALVAQGVINRFGLIVRHRHLGFDANAMTVWDIDDSEVDVIGARLAGEPAVTLCYRRPRRRPLWRYNLFCMVHGRQRQTVEAQIADLAQRHGLERTPHAILFSRRCFRQRGATLRKSHHEERPPCP